MTQDPEMVLNNCLNRTKCEYEFYASQKHEQNKVRQFVNTDTKCYEDFCLVYSLFSFHNESNIGCLPE